MARRSPASAMARTVHRQSSNTSSISAIRRHALAAAMNVAHPHACHACHPHLGVGLVVEHHHFDVMSVHGGRSALDLEADQPPPGAPSPAAGARCVRPSSSRGQERGATTGRACLASAVVSEQGRAASTSPAQYSASSGAGVSVLLRQTGGFEGFLPGGEGAQPHTLPLPPPNQLPDPLSPEGCRCPRRGREGGRPPNVRSPQSRASIDGSVSQLHVLLRHRPRSISQAQESA